MSICNNLPVIDLETILACDRQGAVQQILKACQDLGFFQVLLYYYRSLLHIVYYKNLLPLSATADPT